MAVVVKNLEKISISSFLKRNIKLLIHKLVPNLFIKWLMKKNYTQLGFEITNACNANCSFCAYRFMKRKLKIIETDKIDKIVNEYSKQGGGTINFTPVVGDPLVDKELIKKIKICKSYKNINDIFLYTNGLFLNKFNNKELINSGLTRISISTYIGNAEGYKKYYGSHKYRQVMDNIKNILQVNKKFGNPINIQLHLRVDLPLDRLKNNKDLNFFKKYLDPKSITWLEVYEHWSGLINEKDIPKGAILSKTSSYEQKKKSPCFEMYRRAHILSNGSVGVCSCRDIEGEIVIGDVNKSSLEDIWNGKKLEKYRKDWPNSMPKVCMNCDRYRPVNDYISQYGYNIISTHVRRLKRKIFSNKLNSVN